MTDFRYNRILVFLIAIGLMAALVVGWQRHIVEQNNSRVELVIDYEDIVELAFTEGLQVNDVMDRFKEAGITSLAVYETTLEKLIKHGKVTAVSGADILHGYRAGTLSDPWWRGLVENSKVNGEDVFVIGQDGAAFAEIREDIIRRLGSGRVSDLTGAPLPAIVAKANHEKFIKWNLGLSTQEMRHIAEHGFYVVARPTNYTQVRSEDVAAVFNRMAVIDNISSIMFVGEEALGYPDQLPLTVRHMKERQITLDMIEHPLQLQFLKQDGLTQLASALNYQAARVYVIPKDEQPKLKVAEAVQRWVVTDQERNIRVNLLRKYDKPEPGQTLLETNVKYVTAVRNGLLEKGFTIGRASVFTVFFPPTYLLAIMFVGAVAAGVLLLTLIRPFATRYQYIILAIMSMILIFPLVKGGGVLARQAVATTCAVIFPVLAMTYQLDRWRSKEPYLGGSLLRIIVDGVGGLITTVLLSLAGGLYVAAVLGDVRFFLEMDIYRGVKLTFIAPLFLIAIVYLTRYSIFNHQEEFRAGNVWSQFNKILDYPVYIKSLLGFAVLAVAAWVFVGRSGHTAGVPVPEIEIKLRSFLERVMYARPRWKEVMIGHPAFFIAVMAMYRQWPRIAHFILVVVATIAQGSLVETFAHLRTPVFMSLVRGIDGLLVGILAGIIAVVAVQALHYFSLLLGRRPADHE